jgi:hypothetical protein
MNAPTGSGEPPAGDASTTQSGLPPRFEFVFAIVLALAGLASAWASFQGSKWDKVESEQYALSNAHLTESSQLHIRSGQEQTVAAALFLQWLDATSDGQQLRAAIIENHMPPWFSGEFAAWRASLPADLAQMPPHSPLPEFKGPSLQTALKERTLSDTALRAARSAGKNGDLYDVANVVLATALFLAGIGAVLHSPRGRKLVMVLAAALTTTVVVAMLFTPVTLA